MHPDLGGEHWDAGIINQAYATLRHAKKRAAYDVALLNQYSIKTLSSGGIIGDNPRVAEGHKPTPGDGNHRNYYRLLQVQPDAEQEVIRASYRALLKHVTDEQRPLFDQAFSVLDNLKLRAQYDALLKIYTHSSSVEKLNSANSTGTAPSGQSLATTMGNSTESMLCTIQDDQQAAYAPLIAHYCSFCKTPYLKGDLMEALLFCEECDSPLSPPDEHFITTSPDRLRRMQQIDSAHFYEYWPGKPISAVLGNLSPAGLNLFSPKPLDIAQIIKVSARHFKAVAEVVYCKKVKDSNTVGVRFLAVGFSQSSGSFV